MSKVNIYTDGASKRNPGKGGYGIIMELVGTNYVKEFSQGYRFTTNNRMELLAVIEALRKLKNEGTEVTLYTDSLYVVNAVEKKWVFSWDLVLGGGLDHDAHDRLGAAGAQQDAPGLAHLPLGGGHGVLDGPVGPGGSLVDSLDIDQGLRQALNDPGQLGQRPPYC